MYGLSKKDWQTTLYSKVPPRLLDVVLRWLASGMPHSDWRGCNNLRPVMRRLNSNTMTMTHWVHRPQMSKRKLLACERDVIARKRNLLVWERDRPSHWDRQLQVQAIHRRERVRWIGLRDKGRVKGVACPASKEVIPFDVDPLIAAIEAIKLVWETREVASRVKDETVLLCNDSSN